MTTSTCRGVRFCRCSAQLVRTEPYGPGSARMTRSAFTMLSSADPAQADEPGPIRMCRTRLKTASRRFDPAPATQVAELLSTGLADPHVSRPPVRQRASPTADRPMPGPQDGSGHWPCSTCASWFGSSEPTRSLPRP
jgi:hypothetical protein